MKGKSPKRQGPEKASPGSGRDVSMVTVQVCFKQHYFSGNLCIRLVILNSQ